MQNFNTSQLIWINNQLCTSFNHAALCGALTPEMMADPSQTAAPAFNQASAPQAMVIPQYETTGPNGQRIVTNPYAQLFTEGRSIMVTGVVEDNMAEKITTQLLALETQNPDEDITLIINSPGGSVTAGMQIYDTMNFIKPDIITLCTGQAMSMGAFLLSAGDPGKRFALPSSSIMVHQPSAGLNGTVTDMTIGLQEFQRIKDYLNGCLSKHTGHDVKKIEADLERDNYKSAQDAEAYNLVDAVVTNRSEMENALAKAPAPKQP